VHLGEDAQHHRSRGEDRQQQEPFRVPEPPQDQRQHHRRDERAKPEGEVEEIRRPHQLFTRAVRRNRHPHEHVAHVHLRRPADPQQDHGKQRATVGSRAGEHQDGDRDSGAAGEPDALAADRVGQKSAQQDGRAEHRSEAADETADLALVDLQSIDQRDLQPADQRIRQTHDGQAGGEEDLKVGGIGKVHVQQPCLAPGAAAGLILTEVRSPAHQPVNQAPPAHSRYNSPTGRSRKRKITTRPVMAPLLVRQGG
jgi:hypothetical protein